MKTVFFDLGGVLIDFSHEKMCEQLSRVSGLPAGEVKKFLFESNLNELYETGQIDSQYLHFKLSQVARKQLDFRDVMLAASKIFKPIPKTIELLDALKMKGTRLVLLSNTCEAHFDYANKPTLSCVNLTPISSLTKWLCANPIPKSFLWRYP